ncbi:MAG: GGDEF domain-containing protein [Oxalobacteraceae bacterium]|nr:GGDEF domain-containing protein [Oxalobacteraceae bacterium]
MQVKPPNPQLSIADIARETFRRLATQRIAPTPDAYRAIYNEIAGIKNAPDAEKSIGKPSAPTPTIVTAAPPQPAGNAADAAPQIQLLQEMLHRTLTFGVASLLTGSPALAASAEALGLELKGTLTEPALHDIAKRLRQLCFSIELKSGDSAEQQELLLRLFKLLLDNVSELLEDDDWLRGQIGVVQNIIAGPINHRALEDATRSLKEVIYKQGLVKHSLSEARATLKNMMTTFIDRLGAIAASSSDYHQKIGHYAEKISVAQDIGSLNRILDDVLLDTRGIQSAALDSRNTMIASRQAVQDAETRIQALESQLQQMSELVSEDQLTGSLNRRGLDDVFERELARSERRKYPLCAAMLDLDNFKLLNDTFGHSAGDEALIQTVRIAKEILRPMDVIARFGGEEFLILFPDTLPADASRVLTRLQRALTKHFFLLENERLLVTFSAGVALRAPQEDQATLIKRADAALYQAKQAGKNRVVIAQ